MIRVKNIELELSDRSTVRIGEQPKPLTLKELNDVIITSIFTDRLQHGDVGMEGAQWETAHEVGVRSTSTVYRAIRRV